MCDKDAERYRACGNCGNGLAVGETCPVCHPLVVTPVETPADLFERLGVFIPDLATAHQKLYE